MAAPAVQTNKLNQNNAPSKPNPIARNAEIDATL
jgi:hypothetical protein